jgi:hypothetical protein
MSTLTIRALLREFGQTLKHSAVGKPLMRFLRILIIKALGLVRSSSGLRRKLHLPRNQMVRLWFGETDRCRTIVAPKTCPFSRAMPVLLDPILLPFFAERRVESPEEESLSILKNGRIWGSRYGAVFTSAGEFLPAFSRDPWGPSLHEVWTKPWLPAPRKLRGRALYLVTPEATNNYHHWMIDLLPRLRTAEENGYPLSSFDHVIVNHADQAYQWETLDAFGISKKRVINVDRGLALEVDELVVPSLKKSNETLPEKHLEFLRKNFLHAEAKSNRRRIFLSRKDASHRRLLNEDEVVALFTDYGFERICLSGMSVREQAQLFAQSEIIAGPSGAGFANLVFASPDTRVVELASPGWLTPFHWMISSRLELPHFIATTSEPSSCHVPLIRERASHQRIDLDKIAEVLRRLDLERPSHRDFFALSGGAKGSANVTEKRQT